MKKTTKLNGSILYLVNLNKIDKTGQNKVFHLEQDLTKVLFEMEMLGISIDKEYTLKVQKLLVSVIRLSPLV